MIPFLHAAVAHAFTTNFELSHTVDLVDADSVGDDYFTDGDGTYLARWAYAEIRLASNGTVIDSGYTDDDGMITFTGLSTGVNYRVRLYAEHNVYSAGKKFRVVDDSGDTFWDNSALLSWTTAPNPGWYTAVAYDAADTDNEWVNVAAVGSWTIRRRPDTWPTYAEMNDGTTDWWHQVALKSACATPTANWDPVALEVCIDIDVGGWQYKHIIAHELGHDLSHWVSAVFNGYTGALADLYSMSVDYDAADGGVCPEGDSHSWTSKEYQSAALIEGIADYVSVVAFNNVTQDDCRVQPAGSVEWDPDDNFSIGLPFSCEGWDDTDQDGVADVGETGDDGGVEWYSFAVDSGDFLGDYCVGTGDVDNRGTELDWTRFFYDLDHQEDVSFEVIFTNFAAAYPPDWNADDSGDPADAPRLRLELAFAADDDGAGPDVDLSDVWDTWSAFDGVYR